MCLVGCLHQSIHDHTIGLQRIFYQDDVSSEAAKLAEPFRHGWFVGPAWVVVTARSMMSHSPLHAKGISLLCGTALHVCELIVVNSQVQREGYLIKLIHEPNKIMYHFIHPHYSNQPNIDLVSSHPGQLHQLDGVHSSNQTLPKKPNQMAESLRDVAKKIITNLLYF